MMKIIFSKKMVTVGDLWTVDLTQACSEVALKQQQNYTNITIIQDSNQIQIL